MILLVAIGKAKKQHYFGVQTFVPRFLSRNTFRYVQQNFTWKGRSPPLKTMKIVNESFQKYYDPSSYCAVDEMLTAFKGKNPFRITIKAKPTQTGFKFFGLCDSNAYLYSFYLCQDKSFLENVNYLNLERKPK